MKKEIMLKIVYDYETTDKIYLGHAIANIDGVESVEEVGSR